VSDRVTAPRYRPRHWTPQQIRETELITIMCGLTDRELAVMIYRALQRDPDVVAHMDRYGVTLADLWAIIRRGRR